MIDRLFKYLQPFLRYAIKHAVYVLTVSLELMVIYFNFKPDL